MGKINSYPSDSNVTLADKLIGTDAENNNATKNFEVGAIFDLFNTAYRSYGAFYDTADQTATAINTAKAMSFNTTDFAQDISIVSNNQITLANAGTYNIQFSAQLHDTSGGSSTIDIWLAKNGTAVANTNTKIVMPSNSYHVAAWNFFVDADAGDYYQIMWATSDLDLLIEYEAATGLHPATPSVILTVNQIG